jgi:hypothetical protein
MEPSIVSSRLSSDIRDVEDFGVLIASIAAALRICSLVATIGGCIRYLPESIDSGVVTPRFAGISFLLLYHGR